MFKKFFIVYYLRLLNIGLKNILVQIKLVVKDIQKYVEKAVNAIKDLEFIALCTFFL